MAKPAALLVQVHTHNGTQYDVELWDVGGSPGHREVRPMFYTNVHGVLGSLVEKSVAKT